MTTAPNFRTIAPKTAAELADTVGERPLAGHALPLVLEPATPGIALAAWTERNRERVDGLLHRYGALLFRGFDVDPEDGFARFADAVGSGPLAYTQRSTRRVQAGRGVYTSTEYPATHSIALHSENAFQYEWPARIMFHSVQVAATGGATPIADNVAVYDAIDPEVRDEFVGRGITYLRNLGGGLELPWQETFQTDDPAVVEAYCRHRGIRWEWKDGGARLKTTQVLPAAIRLRAPERRAWFNQAHLFHASNLAAEVREALLAAMPEDDLPRHAYFGDGAPIPDEYLANVRAAYAACLVRFPWRRDDVMLLDNLRACHGRDPFTGTRKVLVSMSDPADYGRYSIGEGAPA